jgi:hypothetical protein
MEIGLLHQGAFEGAGAVAACASGNKSLHPLQPLYVKKK